MACTKEEIERKRLAALQKRQIRVVNNPDRTSLSGDSNVGPIKNQYVSHVSFHPYAKNVKNDSNVSPSSNIATGKFYNIQNKPNLSTKTNSQQNNENNSSGSSSQFSQPILNLGQVVTAKAYLISEHRFEVSISEFCMPLINIFKSISSGQYGKIYSYGLNFLMI